MIAATAEKAGLCVGLFGFCLQAIASTPSCPASSRDTPRASPVPSAATSVASASLGSPAPPAPGGISFPATIATTVPPTVDLDSSAEHWTSELRSQTQCDGPHAPSDADVYRDPRGTHRRYGYNGYAHASLPITRVIDKVERLHCLHVYWPKSDRNPDGKISHVAIRIEPAWFRLVERTLQPLPWRHLQEVYAIVIDNRPHLHGIAPFSRESPLEDARDGHTIWLHEHLFTAPNHWVVGTYGSYWAYHTQKDGIVVDNRSADHDLFSPILIHEIGHIINYNLVNGHPSKPSSPACAQMCGDHGSCGRITQKEREALCATAYCTATGFSSGTENWAEMYRWYFQGSETRGLLATWFPACFEVLSGRSVALVSQETAPWQLGLGEVTGYRKTRWMSCGDRSCKSF